MLYLVTQGQDILERPAPSRVLQAYFGQLLLNFADSFRLTAQMAIILIKNKDYGHFHVQTHPEVAIGIRRSY